MRVHTREEAAATLDYVEALQPIYQERFGVRFVYPTDEWYLVTGREVPPLAAYDDQQLHENGLGLVRQFLDDWEALKLEIRDWRLAHGAPSSVSSLQSLMLATATLFASTLQEKAAEFAALTGTEVEVLPVVNQRLGATITVAGLLMGSDVLAALEEKTAVSPPDLIVLPRVMFDHPDRVALDDIAPQDIANRLNTPIALADTLGDVWDALIGQSQVVYRPQTGSPSPHIPLRLLPDDEDDAHFS